jgi:hypothetical protein
MPPSESERTGELLVEEGIVFQEDLVRGLAEAGLKGTPLARLLESTPHVRRADLAAFLASDFLIPSVADLRTLDLGRSVAGLIPEAVARKHEVVPVARLGDVLCVAKANYFNRAAVQELRKICGVKVKVLQADEAQVGAALDLIYGGGSGTIPAPSGTKRRDATGTRVAPVAAAPAPPSDLEEVPTLDLISPAEEAAPAPAAAAAQASRPPAGDDVLEILDAVRIPSQEYVAAGRNPLARVAIEFEDLFVLGKPVAPGRFS